jgi:hypothetical protein
MLYFEVKQCLIRPTHASVKIFKTYIYTNSLNSRGSPSEI